MSAAARLDVPPAGTWSEPDGNDGADTLPAPPPSRPLESLDLTITPGILSALRNAERLTAGGQHGQARDDARRAFLLLGSELGIAQGVLADLLDGPSDYESAHADGRVVEIPPPREIANLDWQQVERGEHHAAIVNAASGRTTRIIGGGSLIRRVEDGPGWSFRGNAGGGVQVFEHSREECDVIERAAQ